MMVLKSTLFIGCLVFAACTNQQTKSHPPTESGTVINVDSLQLLKKEIALSRNQVNSAFDSLQLYHLNSFNDTCIKYLYTIYHYTYIERDSMRLFLSQCSIKPTRVNRLGNGVFRFSYDTFLYDSIPGFPPVDTLLNAYSMPLEVDLDTFIKKPVEFYVGKYRYATAKAYYHWYQDSLKSESFNNFVKTNRSNISPAFLRLINPN